MMTSSRGHLRWRLQFDADDQDGVHDFETVVIFLDDYATAAL